MSICKSMVQQVSSDGLAEKLAPSLSIQIRTRNYPWRSLDCCTSVAILSLCPDIPQHSKKQSVGRPPGHWIPECGRIPDSLASKDLLEARAAVICSVSSSSGAHIFLETFILIPLECFYSPVASHKAFFFHISFTHVPTVFYFFFECVCDKTCFLSIRM
jgi:hypothetical protein